MMFITNFGIRLPTSFFSLNIASDQFVTYLIKIKITINIPLSYKNVTKKLSKTEKRIAVNYKYIQNFT